MYLMPGQDKNESQQKSKLFNNGKELMTVRAELEVQREREFHLPSSEQVETLRDSPRACANFN